MRFDRHLTTPATLTELGARIERHRLERNLTQAELAGEAGIGRATLQRLESGESVQLTSLIGVLRILGLLEGLDLLVPEPVPSPVERLRTEGRRRQRARRAPKDAAADTTWTWGGDLPTEPAPGNGPEDEAS